MRENAEKTKRQCEEIEELKGRLDKFEKYKDDYHTSHKMTRFTESETCGMEHARCNKSPIHDMKKRTYINRDYTSKEQDLGHSLGEIRMMMKGQEQLHNTKLLHDDSQYNEEQCAFASQWSKLLEFMAHNTRMSNHMHQY